MKRRRLHRYSTAVLAVRQMAMCSLSKHSASSRTALAFCPAFRSAGSSPLRVGAMMAMARLSACSQVRAKGLHWVLRNALEASNISTIPSIRSFNQVLVAVSERDN